MRLLLVLIHVFTILVICTSKFRATSKSILLSPYDIPDPVFNTLPNRK